MKEREIQTRAKLLKGVFHFLKSPFHWKVCMEAPGMLMKPFWPREPTTFSLSDLCFSRGWDVLAAPPRDCISFGAAFAGTESSFIFPDSSWIKKAAYFLKCRRAPLLLLQREGVPSIVCSLNPESQSTLGKDPSYCLLWFKAPDQSLVWSCRI